MYIIYLQAEDGPWGIFKCGFCPECLFIQEGAGFHVVYARVGVVYQMTCDCGTFYMTKTKRPSHKRIHDHIYFTSKLNTPDGWHVGRGGGNFDKQVLQ